MGDAGASETMEARLAAVLAAVPELAGEGAVTLLAGGITNRNHRVDVGASSFVVRLAGERTELLGIDRAREHAASRAAEAAGIGAEVVAFLPELDALVTRFVPGKVLGPEDMRDEAMLGRAARALRCFHDGPAIPGHFSVFETVRRYAGLAAERGVQLPGRMGEALSALGRIEATLPASERACPCHNDLLPANFIWQEPRLVILDWEYAAMGDRFFDLGNLAVNHALEPHHERALLEAYFGEVREADLLRLRRMRLVSDMRESLWGYLQSSISGIEFDFLGYGRHHLDRFMGALEPAGH